MLQSKKVIQKKKTETKKEDLVLAFQHFSQSLSDETVRHLSEIGQSPEHIETLLEELSEDLSKICKKYTNLDLKNLIQ